jgi:hypothetical protein
MLQLSCRKVKRIWSSANSAFADDSRGKCPSCSAVTSSPANHKVRMAKAISDNPGQGPRLEKAQRSVALPGCAKPIKAGRDLSLVAEFPDRELVVLLFSPAYSFTSRSRGLVSRGTKNLVCGQSARPVNTSAYTVGFGY